ncbi:MAG: HEAT repeat domain-containing protein [Candidatus Hydrogenedentes bacterium]|nr:HEAT repeat domain-containing protein [Candidatus Hydrogenedentota bacterium]
MKSGVVALSIVLISATAHAGITELVAALSDPNGEARLAAIEAIAPGQYGADAIGPVAELLNNANPAIAGDARVALERVVGPLTQESSGKAAASTALLSALSTVENPAGRRWVYWLISYAGGKEAVAPLVALLDKDSETSLALFALQSIGGQEVADVLLAKLPEANDERRVAIINVLGAVGGTSTVAALAEEAKRDDPVGLAAIEALGRIGALESEPVLWDRLTQHAEPKSLSAYLRMVEKQSNGDALPLYQKLLTLKGDPKARCAALTGVGRTGDSNAVETVLPYLASERSDVHGAACSALVALPGEQVDAHLTKRLDDAAAPVRATILGVLAARDSEGSRQTVERGLQDPEAEVRSSALSILAETGDKKYEPEFLRQAKSGEQTMRPIALRGYLNLADAAFAEGDATQALAMYHTALEIADQDAERKRALLGLARIASPDTLPYLEKLAGTEGVSEEVGLCALAIADKNRDTDPDMARTIYRRMVVESPIVLQAARAGDGLRAMGDSVDDVPRNMGFISRWKLIGPFPSSDFNAVFPPESTYEPDAEYEGVEGAKLRWTDLVIDHVRGIVELDRILKPNEQVIAYAYTVLDVPQAMSAQLWLGSDDGVKVWVNGEVVHSNNASRRVKIDNDKVPINLVAGRNTILLKIVQGGSGCGFCIRTMTADGKPLVFPTAL